MNEYLYSKRGRKGKRDFWERLPARAQPQQEGQVPLRKTS
jgi:hypothetical protein